MTVLLATLAVLQVAAFLVLMARLQGGRKRSPPIQPLGAGLDDTTVTVIVPTLNEGRRVGPCLAGLHAQGSPLTEVIVVDSGSTDDTRAQVEAMRTIDPRFRLVDDRPLPDGWIGKAWALEHGRSLASGEWILGIDADVAPNAGLVAGVVAAARARELDIVSFSPCFGGMTPAEQWVQPALLTTLVYRTGAAGMGKVPPGRLLANGQCFLSKASVLEEGGGYGPARASFSEDVTLARDYATRGWRVAFLDGSRLYVVRSYESLAQMWREWGRSIDLNDSTTRLRQVGDAVLLILAQAMPLPLLLLWATGIVSSESRVLTDVVIGVNAAFLMTRLLMLGALVESYQHPRVAFWLSPLADIAAVGRVLWSTVVRPRTWRGRTYA